MITRINKIDDLGIFNGHKQSPQFKRFLLFYGWNGSGKTTLSRLFAALNSGAHYKYPSLKYEIETNTEGKFNQNKPYPQKIKVFNKEYIEENAPSLEDPLIPTKHIFVLGKEDKTLAKSIENNRRLLELTRNALTKSDPKQGVIPLPKQLEIKEKEHDDLFTNIAREIASIRSGVAVRQYKSPQAILAYKDLGQKQVLIEQEVEKNKSLLRQELQEEIQELDVDGLNHETENLKTLLLKVKSALKATIQRKVIQRLDENPDIAEWVEKGLDLHSAHRSGACEYCQQPIPKLRVEELAAHFNSAHKEIVLEIDSIIDALQASWVNINSAYLQNKALLYKDLQVDYENKKKDFEEAKKYLLDCSQKAGEVIKLKRIKINEVFSINNELENNNLESVAYAINDVINIHNNRSKEFSKVQNEAFGRLEKHYISSIHDSAKLLEENIIEIKNEIKNKHDEEYRLTQKINEAESKLRNTKDGCDSLNKTLINLLGRKELIFEDGDLGYIIKRNGEPANDLSEGEKSLIAFAHFLTHLTEKDFSLKDGIVIIDDPISSMDLDVLYRVVGLIKSRLKNAHQLIILTHNYDFFNQIKGWFISDPDIAFRNKDPQKIINGEILMIKNPFNKAQSIRIGEITELDKLLREYESEYHYLFKKLFSFEEDLTEKADGTIEAVYHYPNIARKTLECFLSFRVPEPLNFYSKVKKLKHFNKEIIKDEELEEIYAFVNSNSHLDTKTGLVQFDPKLAKNGKEYIKMTLELIEKADKEHYKSMVEQIE